MKKLWQYFYKYRARHLAALVTLLFVANLFILKGYRFIDTTQMISLAGHYVTAFAVFFAAFQFRANHDWNRRQLAITEAQRMRDAIGKSINLIDKKYNYANRRKHNAISVEEIHRGMCVIDEKGNLVRNKEGKFTIDHKGEGGKVDMAISHVLGAYEYLATGIRQGVFDEELIYRLYGGPLIRSAGIFSDYIEHVNTDMYPGRNGKIYENMKYVAKKFGEREEDQSTKDRSPTDS